MDAIAASLRRAGPPGRAAATTAAPVPSALRYGCLPGLLLWLAGLGLIDEAAFEAAGLDRAALDRLRADHGAELIELKQLTLCGERLTQAQLAALLRPRIAEISLSAATPGDMARVSRALRWLPGWIWGTGGDAAQTPTDSSECDARLDAEFEAGLAKFGATTESLAEAMHEHRMEQYAAASAAHSSAGFQPANRAERRRLAKLSQ